MSQSSKDLMMNLQAVCFAIDDTRLFLDTHPFEIEALKHYQNCKKQRIQALEEYEKICGPILSYDVNENDHWTWVEHPWPWEGEV